ncbi:hypothetical protein CPB86DRAFT_800466, partial [Serendipita vermifera]
MPAKSKRMVGDEGKRKTRLILDYRSKEHRIRMEYDDRNAAARRGSSWEDAYLGALSGLDSARAIANLARDTFAVAPVPSAIKEAAKVLVTLLEAIREVRSNREAWTQLGTVLSNQINDLRMNIEGCSPPHSREFLHMANRYELKLHSILNKVRIVSSRNLVNHHLNRRTDKEEIAQLTSDMDSHWNEFMLEVPTKTHEAVDPHDVNHQLLYSGIEKLEILEDCGWDIHQPCLPGTRIPVLNAINAWADSPSSDQLLWLTDVAGSGKSTIARHLAGQWKESGRLGGFFSFNKNIKNATSIRLFCNTIAVELACHPKYKSQLQSSIAKGLQELGPSPPFSEKFMKLVIEPSKGFELVLVIDALDECFEHDRATLLNCILSMRKYSHGLKVFITSRPELDIERWIHKYRSHTDSLHDAKLKSNQTDIETFVGDQMRNLVLDGQLDSMDVRRLCKRVNCLFILASTVCRAICSHPNPAEMVEIFLDSNTNSLVPINELYLKILEDACQMEDLEERLWRAMQGRMMQVLKAIMSATTPVSVSSLDAILGIKGSERVVKSLASCLSVAPNKTVHLLHPTFREFLVDGKAAKQFYINMEEAHGLMAKGCLQVMESELKFNICGL